MSVPDYNPWQPMKVPKDLKTIGKLGEELCEAGAAVFRCVIQGIDEVEPVTKKPNRQWLTEEIADVLANVGIAIEHFDLDCDAIEARVMAKREKLLQWHNML